MIAKNSFTKIWIFKYGMCGYFEDNESEDRQYVFKNKNYF